jgi:hypothetical protein
VLQEAQVLCLLTISDCIRRDKVNYLVFDCSIEIICGVYAFGIGPALCAIRTSSVSDKEQRLKFVTFKKYVILYIEGLSNYGMKAG